MCRYKNEFIRLNVKYIYQLLLKRPTQCQMSFKMQYISLLNAFYVQHTQYIQDLEHVKPTVKKWKLSKPSS